LNSKAGRAQPIIFPNLNFLTISNFPSKTHPSSFSCPDKTIEELRTICITGGEDIWLGSIIFEVYKLFPEFTVVSLISLDPRGKQTGI
jgi:hypothetical protein